MTQPEKKSIEVHWKGPLCLGQQPDNGLIETADGPGVYVWHYTREYYGKPGLHFGSSNSSMLVRYWAHVGNTMSGLDTVYEKNGEGTIFYTNAKRTTEFFEKIDMIFEALKSMEVYFAKLEDSLGPFAERAFIDSYNCLRDDMGYMHIQSAHRTSAPPHILEIANTGSNGFLPCSLKAFVYDPKMRQPTPL